MGHLTPTGYRGAPAPVGVWVTYPTSMGGMLGTLTEIFEAERGSKGPTCKLPKILAKLDPDDRAIVEAWLADPDVEHAHIARTLTKVGHPIQGQSLGRHRTGSCQCNESPVR